jgi:hypothetical protein
MSGYEWCQLLNSKYKKVVWLNPRYHGSLNALSWMESENRLAELFHMYMLSVDGLQEAIRYLMAPR